MHLAQFLTASSVALDITASSREVVLEALVDLLGIEGRQRTTLLRLLTRRELLGSTAVGHSLAVPHCRTLVVPRVRMAYVRLATPLQWEAPDGVPVRHVFMIVAPPVEVSNQYLPALGRLARFAKEPGVITELDQLTGATEFSALLDRHGA
ncbi:MAG: PTS sugar transporter subunit IIA [Gemmatimonadota bacterium]